MEEKIVDTVRLKRFKENLINWINNNTASKSRVLNVYYLNDIKGLIVDPNHDLTIAFTRADTTYWFRLAKVERVSVKNIKMYLRCEQLVQEQGTLVLTLGQTVEDEYRVTSVESGF